jgi:hypothetical protein
MMSLEAPLIHRAASSSINTSSYISHNPGISILSGLAIVGVTEPLALPWVALGTVTPFILGYMSAYAQVQIYQHPS